jgi:peptidyl-prolyl cis-trans isomerase SurA
MSRVRSERIFLAFLGAAILLCIVVSGVRAELIDRIVAAVNNDVITLSELRQAVAFNQAMGSKGEGRRLEAETLVGLINRRLLVQEASRTRVVEVTAEDVAAERAQLRKEFGSDEAFRAFLERTGLTEARLDRMLRERLLVERFVQKKIGLFVRVSREDAENYFAEHAAEFPGQRFPEVQAKIMALLSDQKAGQELDQYLADLRSRADIRTNPLDDE